MKVIYAFAAVGLCLMGPASAQSYGGRDYGYGERDDGYRGRGGRDRDDGYRDRGGRDRDDGYRDRGDRGGSRDYGFNERAYLRCNPDVLAAVNRGQMKSGAAHYQVFGRREGRRLSC